MVNVYTGDKHMSINEVTPKEWDSLKAKGPDKPEDCLMSAQKPKTITGSLYHPADSMLDKQMFPEGDQLGATSQQLSTKLAVFMGGRAAEELIFN